MHVIQELPANARHILRIDLQSDKQTALRVNLVGIALMAVMGLLFHLFAVPVGQFLGCTGSIGSMALHAAVLIVGYAAYIVLHELTHAAVMKAFGASKVRFGFTGLYAYAGSEQDYFDKPSYLLVAMAPIVVWGIIFLVIQLLVPAGWAWIVWFLQIGNVSGSAGDLYVSWRMLRLPRAIRVRDTGIRMDVYGETPADTTEAKRED